MDSEKSETKIVIDSEYAKKNAESFYDRYYTHVSLDEMKWRKFSAIEKCNSIVELCSDFKYHKVVDIGCGLCNIISRLNELSFADEFYGVEVSSSVVRFIQDRIQIPQLKAVYLIDTSNMDFETNSFDLGILTHVIEHIPNPDTVLREALRVCKHVLIEVPLEDCLSVNVFSRIREKMGGRARTDNPAGHIHFFAKSSFRKLVKESGGRILGERTYRSWKVFHTKFRPSTIIRYFQSILFYIIFKITGTLIVASHYALLIEKSRTR
ncbi:MAG: class I SAM-dependent methyltransferase [Candidatus Thorarchaeota archaeon]|jgi:ubiquinone/menaquinone biosynthesis C-methylase UbiE